MHHFFTILLVFLLLSTPASAQTPISSHISEKDGLPTTNIYDILQDNQGFMWLATDHGLYRYDGRSFKRYSHQKKKGWSVFKLSKDLRGRIWCTNLSGQFFYIENDKLELFVDLGEEYPINTVSYYNFDETNEHIYIPVAENVFSFNIATKKLNKKKFDRLLSPNKYQSISTLNTVDQINIVNGITYILSRFCFYRILGEDVEVIQLDSTFPPNLPYIRSFNKVGNHVFIVSDLKKLGIKRWDEQKKQLIEVHLPKEIAFSRHLNIMKDSHGYYWIGSTNGAFQCQFSGDAFTLVSSLYKNKFITKIIEDQNGSLWFASYENGLYKIPDLDSKIRNSSNTSLPSDYVEAFSNKKEEGFFIGMHDGNVGFYSPTAGRMQWLNKVTSSPTNKLYYNEKHNSLVVTRSTGTQIWNFNSNQIYRYLKLQSLKDINALNNENNVIASKFDNLSIIQDFFPDEGFTHKGNFKKIIPLNRLLRHSKIRLKRSYCNFYNRYDQSIYGGHTDDLYYYKGEEKRPVRIDNRPITAVDIDGTEDSLVWVGTHKYGLLGIKKDSVVYQYDKNNGLLSNTVKKIFGDEKGVWIGMENGIQYVKYGLDEIVTIDANDGLPPFKLSDLTVVGDTLYVATNIGLLSFDKTKKYNNKRPPNIYLTAMAINEKDTLLSDSYNLSHQENSLKLDFHSISFRRKTPNGYKYRLIGLQDKWINTESNFVRFTSLPPGQYVFQVKAINEDGVESIEAAAMEIIIRHAFWQTWWFYLLAVLLVMALLYAFFMQRIGKINQKKEIEKELIASKLTALRSQMNPHFMFNALNSIQKYIVTSQKWLAIDYLGKFSNLMRMYLDQSRKHMIGLQEELDTLQLYMELENLRFSNTITFDIDFLDKINPSTIFIPPLVIQPYVENAIKHGLFHSSSEKKLKISFEICDSSSKMLLCKIKDNGVGREKSSALNAQRPEKHMSFATGAGKDRLALLNQSTRKKTGVDIHDLYDENNQPLGTEVLLKIPFYSKRMSIFEH